MNISCKEVTLKILPLILMILLSKGQIMAQATKEEFKPSGKVWGYAFGDFYFKGSGDTAIWAGKTEYSGVPKEVYAFSFRRMYLGYDYNISPRFSTTALLEGGDGFLTLRGDRSVTIKALNVRWKGIYKGADLLIGQIPTLTFSLISEKVWNYRSIEKTITDQRGIRGSSDMGVALYGLFDSLGNYGYNVMIGNGSGTKPEELTPVGKHKVFYGDLFAYLFDRKIVMDLYGDYQTGLKDKNIITVKGFVACQTEPITIGLELLSQTQYKVKSDTTNATPFGISLWARGSIIKDKLNAFARFDSYNPEQSYREKDVIKTYNSANMNKHYDEQFMTAGLDFTPHKNVHIMPNIWINSYKAKADTEILVKREADIVPRLTFYFIYR